MKKKIIYTNKDNEDFTIESHLNFGKPDIRFHIISGNDALYFMDLEEVKEFCEILKTEAELVFSNVK